MSANVGDVLQVNSPTYLKVIQILMNSPRELKQLFQISPEVDYPMHHYFPCNVGLHFNITTPLLLGFVLVLYSTFPSPL